MEIRRRLTALAIVLLFMPASPAPARRGDAQIDQVQMRREAGGLLLVDFRVRGALDPRVLEALDSGIPVKFRYRLKVVRRRELAPDEVLLERDLSRVLEKDNLKNRYWVSVDGGSGRGEFPTVEEAVDAMTAVTGVPLLGTGELPAEGECVLRIKAELQKFKLPFHLHYLFAFLSILDVETDWHEAAIPFALRAGP